MQATEQHKAKVRYTRLRFEVSKRILKCSGESYDTVVEERCGEMDVTFCLM